MSVVIFTDGELTALGRALLARNPGLDERHVWCALTALGLANRAAYRMTYSDDDEGAASMPDLPAGTETRATFPSLTGWATNLLYNCVSNGGSDFAPEQYAIAFLKWAGMSHVEARAARSYAAFACSDLRCGWTGDALDVAPFRPFDRRCPRCGGTVEGRPSKVSLSAVSDPARFDRRSVMSPTTKLWLDDLRPAPEGWTWVRTASEAKGILAEGNVSELSLDHDLGDDMDGTGYSVAAWLEEQVAEGRLAPPPVISIHSANPVGRARIEAAIASVKRLTARRTP